MILWISLFLELKIVSITMNKILYSVYNRHSTIGLNVSTENIDNSHSC